MKAQRRQDGEVMRGHLECHSENSEKVRQKLDLANVIWVSEGPAGQAFP